MYFYIQNNIVSVQDFTLILHMQAKTLIIDELNKSVRDIMCIVYLLVFT